MTEIELHIHARRWAEAIEASPILADLITDRADGFLRATDPQHGDYTVQLWQDEEDGRWHILTAEVRTAGESSSHPCNYKGGK